MQDGLNPIDENFGGTDNSPQKKIIVTVIVLAVVFLLAFISATLVTKYVTKTFTVDGSSMYPTLNGGIAGDYTDGDKVVVNRLAKLKRGDIVVLNVDGFSNALVKRVVALGGDTLEIKEGKVYVNDSLVEESYLTDENKVMLGSSEQPLNREKITIAQDDIFFLGDNRLVSNDSRYLGSRPLSVVEGKVFMIIRENKTLNFPNSCSG